MITLTLAALATVASPVPAAAPAAAYAGETIAAMKGHPVAARGAARAARSAPAVCHPDPAKGRACRHEIAQAEARDTAVPTLAVAELGAEPR